MGEGPAGGAEAPPGFRSVLPVPWAGGFPEDARYRPDGHSSENAGLSNRQEQKTIHDPLEDLHRPDG